MNKIFDKLKTKKLLSIIGTSLLFLLLVLMIVGIYRVYKSFTSIDMIKGEEYIGKEKSPDGRYEVQAFRNNGGATTDYAVLVILVDLKKNTKKNIFWDYHCDQAEMKWHSNDKIEINGIVLQVPNEVYDYRKRNVA